MSFDTGETPTYDEIMERFGEKTTLDRALAKTAAIQEEYPFVAIGSVLSHEEVYGNQNLRQTSYGLDFIGPATEIEAALEESDESWQYQEALVYVDDESENEWMVAVLPIDCSAFEDQHQGEFRFQWQDWKDSRILGTEQGTIETVSPEPGYASKMRRYLMQKQNRDSFKKGDVIDMASMALEERRNALVDPHIFSTYIDRYLNLNAEIEEIKSDFEETLLNEDLDANISQREIEDVLTQVDEWFR